MRPRCTGVAMHAMMPSRAVPKKFDFNSIVVNVLAPWADWQACRSPPSCRQARSPSRMQIAVWRQQVGAYGRRPDAVRADADDIDSEQRGRYPAALIHDLGCDFGSEHGSTPAERTAVVVFVAGHDAAPDRKQPGHQPARVVFRIGIGNLLASAALAHSHIPNARWDAALPFRLCSGRFDDAGRAGAVLRRAGRSSLQSISHRRYEPDMHAFIAL